MGERLELVLMDMADVMEVQPQDVVEFRYMQDGLLTATVHIRNLAKDNLLFKVLQT